MAGQLVANGDKHVWHLANHPVPGAASLLFSCLPKQQRGAPSVGSDSAPCGPLQGDKRSPAPSLSLSHTQLNQHFRSLPVCCAWGLREKCGILTGTMDRHTGSWRGHGFCHGFPRRGPGPGKPLPVQPTGSPVLGDRQPWPCCSPGASPRVGWPP